ncbi:activating transcription factor 3-like [Patiria miniata]|uniref:BZIP domain-containing protein n=1 Tax=Patiria miniata TaxID=46514 RepID=A0A914BA70_PATMI|nr:activating transcription factor 3-like [Patiria miniata]
MLSVFALTAARQPTGGYGLKMTEDRRAITGEKAATDREDKIHYTEFGEGDDIQGDTGDDRREIGPLDGQDGGGSEGDEAGSSNTLSPDDEMRIQQRRERNRLAAARCRDRRRQRAAGLVQESDNLEGQNDKLMEDIAQLEKEKRKLEETLRHHLPKCALQRRPPPTQQRHNPPLHQVDDQQQLPSHRHAHQHQPYSQQYQQHQLLQQQQISQVHCHPQPHCQLHQQSHCQPNQRYDSQYQQHQLQSHQQALPLNQRSVEGQPSTYPLVSNQFC